MKLYPVNHLWFSLDLKYIVLRNLLDLSYLFLLKKQPTIFVIFYVVYKLTCTTSDLTIYKVFSLQHFVYKD